MFYSIKKYYLKNEKDTKIMFSAIESLFSMGELPHKSHYKCEVEKYIKDEKMIDFFRKTCNLLEVLSFADGFYLEDEMIYFLTGNAADFFYEGYEESEKVNPRQYIRVWENLESNYGYSDDDLCKFAEIMEQYYVENGK